MKTGLKNLPLKPIVLCTLTFWVNSAFGQVIRLEKQVTVEARQDVRLGDVAKVTGIDRQLGEDLSNTVILSKIESSRTIKAESVLLALMSQQGTASLAGSLQITGSAQCSVVVSDVGRAVKESIPQTIANAADSPGKPALTDTGTDAPTLQKTTIASTAAIAAPRSLGNPPAMLAVDENLTLSKVILTRVLQDSNEPADKVRMRIETNNPLLTAPVASGRKWICRPLTRTMLGTVVFESQLVEGSHILEKLNIQTTVEHCQRVVVVLGKLGRGDVVAAGMVRAEDTWLDRKMANLFSGETDVVGLEAQRSIEIGSMLDQRDFRPAMMALKGDAVTVIYPSGSLKVQMRARAMEEGKLHDQVEMKNEVTGERYQATMIGRRLAVVGASLTEIEEQQLRETR